jgi:hypothetical protein
MTVLARTSRKLTDRPKDRHVSSWQNEQNCCLPGAVCRCTSLLLLNVGTSLPHYNKVLQPRGLQYCNSLVMQTSTRTSANAYGGQNTLYYKYCSRDYNSLYTLIYAGTVLWWRNNSAPRFGCIYTSRFPVVRKKELWKPVCLSVCLDMRFPTAWTDGVYT